MQYKLIVTQKAQNDIIQATDWYETQQKGLGKKYMVSVKESIKLLAKNPTGFAIICFQIRRINTKNFPYSIFFIIENKVVIVFAVTHNSRDEETWKQRIDK